MRPKPCVEIGGRPILWHIMKTYAQLRVSEFVLCLGYKGESYQAVLCRIRPPDKRHHG